MQTKMELPPCDFCNREPVGYFPCDPFEITSFPADINEKPSRFEYDGQWWACTSCKKMVESGNWSALMNRFLRQLTSIRGNIPSEQEGNIRLHTNALWMTFERYRENNFVEVK